jgi:hypothetical protein
MGSADYDSVDASMMIKVIAFLPLLNVLSSQNSTLTCFVQIKIALCKQVHRKPFLTKFS